jgi:NAD(P)-dependent dehydrogenase (short-subunit alcohol dehydrogenase family)|tara:strand:- start:3630 stop:4403 length:774 start_codon:yes stop_codon:yes gene_type:complete
LVQNFENKLVLITGASRGIGKSIALALAKDGAHVICAATEARNSGKVVTEIQAAGGKATAIGCLVENPLAVKRMFAEVLDQAGPVDVLINNAGISKPMLTMEMTEENWDQHMNINCKSIFLCSQAAALQMKIHNGGSIINIGSILGRNAFPATLGYCASKAAVDQMTKVMAIEWARYGIRVNCIAPGYIRTELIDQLAVDGKVKLEDLERRTPQRRLGTGDDIANAVRYVASEGAAFMTGETLVVDGGWTAFGYYQT